MINMAATDKPEKIHIMLYGGSFDPPHMGHVMVLAYAIGLYQPDEVWVLPTYKHVLKDHQTASFESRLEMCQQAFSMFKAVSIMDLEQYSSGFSYDTWQLCAKRATERGLSTERLHWSWLIGSDLLDQVDNWYQAEAFKYAVELVCVERAQDSEASKVEDDKNWTIPNISSSALRAGLERGEDISRLLPRDVMALIIKNRLYGYIKTA